MVSETEAEANDTKQMARPIFWPRNEFGLHALMSLPKSRQSRPALGMAEVGPGLKLVRRRN